MVILLLEHYSVKYTVTIQKKALKDIKKAPARIQRKFDLLVEDLENSGPVQGHWPNYSMLGKVTYHCHLDYHWVACWRHETESIVIEVYYAGSRENSPY
jgi:mRNA-degrading endonuclease RelE of RelBE toxin-antitoxin system